MTFSLFGVVTAGGSFVAGGLSVGAVNADFAAAEGVLSPEVWALAHDIPTKDPHQQQHRKDSAEQRWAFARIRPANRGRGGSAIRAIRRRPRCAGTADCCAGSEFANRSKALA